MIQQESGLSSYLTAPPLWLAGRHVEGQAKVKLKDLLTQDINCNNLIYFVKYSLDLHAYQGLILGVSSGTAFLAIPFWAYAAIKIGKRNSWMIAMSLLLIGFVIFYVFYPIFPNEPFL